MRRITLHICGSRRSSSVKFKLKTATGAFCLECTDIFTLSKQQDKCSEDGHHLNKFSRSFTEVQTPVLPPSPVMRITLFDIPADR